MSKKKASVPAEAFFFTKILTKLKRVSTELKNKSVP